MRLWTWRTAPMNTACSADEHCVSQWRRSELEAANSLKIDCGGDQSAKVRMLKSDEAMIGGVMRWHCRSSAHPGFPACTALPNS